MSDKEDFDTMLHKLAKAEPILVPDGFEERNNNVIKNLVLNKKTSRTIKNRKLKFAFTVLILFFSLGSIAVTAQHISGGDFFKDFFSKIADNDINNNYDYMDTEQLEGLESSTIGTVVDTPEITIDILGIIKSGNTVDIMLKVKANQLDSVFYNNKENYPLKNYRFNNNILGTLSEGAEQISYRYYYSDEDKSLEPNQFKILYTFIGVKNLDKKDFTLGFSDFGYFPFNKGILSDFHTLYKEEWNFNISLDSIKDSYKQIYLNQSFVYNDSKIIAELLDINSLSCTIKFKLEEYSDGVFDYLSKNASGFKFLLDNGQTITSKQFEYTSGGNSKEKEAEVIITFKVPITVENVKSISLFDKNIDIK
jgi:hypothetical protein